jgi:hypothetical protein
MGDGAHFIRKSYSSGIEKRESLHSGTVNQKRLDLEDVK